MVKLVSRRSLNNSGISGLENVFNGSEGSHLFDDIEKPKGLNSAIGNPMAKKSALEPLDHPQKGKLEPLENKPQPKNDEFDLLDLDGFGEPEKKQEAKKDQKIDDDYGFDFEFESHGPEEGSKIPPNDSDPNDQAKASIDMEKFEREKEKSKANPNKDKDDEEEDWLIIEGKRYREINIEGDDNEYIMDEEGNIYDLKGVYIGTAKDGGEESEEEED
eukprot:CAMPEP_0196996040 /NCGR_PEP_ID=MMETSP1380-20130617/2026_1 /TAXON_ID=5936 /ORGANISM="Euplotes crassus, Strain CT5" /LENGTH=216 /DNA_ID=CAMNT_0042411891 /DNA_START=329 /DNA_END=977 /DNA_ORIENTATION=-